MSDSVDSVEKNSRDETSRAAFLKNTSILSLLTLASRFLGLVREVTKAALLGTAGIADAFAVAFTIPNFFRRLFAEGSVTVAFIPTFKGYLASGDARKTREFLSATFTVLVITVSATVALGVVATPLIVSMFGSDPVETAILTRIMFPFLALVSVAALLQGILNGVEVFAPSGVAPILFNVCFIAVPVIIAPWSENAARAMAVGVIAGGTAQALCQLPAVLKRGFRFGFIDPRAAFRNPGMKRVFALIGPTIIGMAAYQLNQMVSTQIASFAGSGISSSLEYSLRLQEFMLGIFAVSIGTVLLPELSGAAKGGDDDAFNDKLRRGMDAIALLTIPVAAMAAVGSREVVTLVFKLKEFSDESVALTASAFFWHILGLYFIAVNRVVAPAFYAREDTKSPTKAGVASFALNIPLAFALSFPMKGAGIALSLSVSSCLNMVLLFAFLKPMRGLDFAKVVKGGLLYALRLALFSLLAAVPAWFLMRLLRGAFGADPNRFVSAGIPLALSSLAFSAVGITCLALSRDHVAASLARTVLRRRKPA